MPDLTQVQEDAFSAPLKELNDVCSKIRELLKAAHSLKKEIGHAVSTWHMVDPQPDNLGVAGIHLLSTKLRRKMVGGLV